MANGLHVIWFVRNGDLYILSDVLSCSLHYILHTSVIFSLAIRGIATGKISPLLARTVDKRIKKVFWSTFYFTIPIFSFHASYSNWNLTNEFMQPYLLCSLVYLYFAYKRELETRELSGKGDRIKRE